MPDQDNTISKTVFLTEQQVADTLCQSVRTLQKWRVTGSGPCFYKFGQSVRYSLVDIHEWVANRRLSHTSQPLPKRPKQ